MVKLRDNRYGVIVEHDKRYADILVRLGKHSLVAEAAPPAEPQESQAPQQDGTETAEPPQPAASLSSPSYSTAALSPAIVAEDDTGPGPRREAKPRRSYARRDLTAEE